MRNSLCPGDLPKLSRSPTLSVKKSDFRGPSSHAIKSRTPVAYSPGPPRKSAPVSSMKAAGETSSRGTARSGRGFHQNRRDKELLGKRLSESAQTRQSCHLLKPETQWMLHVHVHIWAPKSKNADSQDARFGLGHAGVSQVAGEGKRPLSLGKGTRRSARKRQGLRDRYTRARREAETVPGQDTRNGEAAFLRAKSPAWDPTTTPNKTPPRTKETPIAPTKLLGGNLCARLEPSL